MIDIERNKKEFIEAYQAAITREGADKFLKWLQTTDFFTAPASTKYHGSFPGGLCWHSLNVYSRLIQEKPSGTPETIALVSLLHDVCKTNYYKQTFRNVKNEKTGQWEKEPFYTVEDQLPYGHGEKSVYIIGGFMRLTREEALAIRFHMGAYEGEKSWGIVGEAFAMYPLGLLLHVADMKATYFDEVFRG